MGGGGRPDLGKATGVGRKNLTEEWFNKNRTFGGGRGRTEGVLEAVKKKRLEVEKKLTVRGK